MLRIAVDQNLVADVKDGSSPIALNIICLFYFPDYSASPYLPNDGNWTDTEKFPRSGPVLFKHDTTQTVVCLELRCKFILENDNSMNTRTKCDLNEYSAAILMVRGSHWSFKASESVQQRKCGTLEWCIFQEDRLGQVPLRSFIPKRFVGIHAPGLQFV